MAVIDLLGASIASLDEIRGLCADKGEDEAGPWNARRLNLHMNQIKDLTGLTHFAFLEELILSANCINQLRSADFAALSSSLRLLDLSCNALTNIDGLRNLRRLEELRLAYNRIDTLEGQQQFWSRHHSLKLLDMRCNKIAGLSQLLFLGGCTKLERLALQEAAEDRDVNPICGEPNYRRCVLQVLPWLRVLDGSAVPEEQQAMQESRQIDMDAAASCPASHPPTKPSHAQIRAEVEHVEAEYQIAEQEAAAAEAEALKALQTAREVGEARSQATRQAESEREARLHVDLEEIVMAVQKHEDHFAEQLTRLKLAEGEQAAAEATAQEESTALAQEQQQLQKLTLNEHNERMAAAHLKSEKADAEQRLLQWEQQIRAPFARCADVTGLRDELVLSAQRLQEARLRLERTSLGDQSREQLDAANSAVIHHEALVAELRQNLGQADVLLRAWNAEAAAAAASGAELRGVAADEARRDADELASASAMSLHLQESESRWICEQQLMQKEIDLLTTSGLAERASNSAEGAGIGLLSEHCQLQRLVEEKNCSTDHEARAVGMLKEKLAAALEQATMEIEQSRCRLSAAQTALVQKGKVLKLAQEQDDLDAYVMTEMGEQLEALKAVAASALLKAAEVSGQAEVAEAAASEGLHATRQLERTIEELLQETAASVPRGKYDERRKAVEDVASELQQLRSEDSSLQLRLQDLQTALERRREDLSKLLGYLQTSQDAADDTAQKLNIKLQMIADARSRMGTLRSSMQQADVLRQEDDVSWRDRLSKDAAAAEAYSKQADALRAADNVREEEVAKLSKRVQAKGERNGYVEMQLEEVRKMAREKASVFEAKVAELESQSARVLQEARLAQSEMEDRFRSERAEQHEQERRGRSQVASLRRQLREAPGALKALSQRIGQERNASQLRVRSLLAGFSSSS